MKKITLLLLAIIFNTIVFSCEPESIADKVNPQACCGEGEEIPPPPTSVGSGD